MNKSIINKDDYIKSNGKIYCVISLSGNIVIGKCVNNKLKEINISNIEKIIFKEVQQKKIQFAETNYDKLKSINEQLKNSTLLFREIQKLKKKRNRLQNKIVDNKSKNNSITQYSLF